MVIAGFYTAMLLTGRFAPNRGGTLGAFYFSRFARLYPAFISSVLLTIVWGWWVKTAFPSAILGFETWTPLSNLLECTKDMSIQGALLTWLPNVALVGADILPLLNLTHGHIVEIAAAGAGEPPWGSERMWLGWALIIPPSWSLGIIFSFYLITPLLMRLPNAKLSLLLGAWSMLIWIAFGHLFFYSGYFVGVFWYWLFCLGILSFFAYRKFRAALDRACAVGWARVCMFVGTAGAFLWMFTMNSETGDVARGFLIACLLPLAASSSQSIRLDRYAGRLSYPLFCSHMLFLSASELIVREFGLWSSLNLPMTILGSLIFSVAVVRYLEDPLEPLRTRLTCALMVKSA
jgi:peptidoglycan/LPS O-acetylase OafA/YrhL